MEIPNVLTLAHSLSYKTGLGEAKHVSCLAVDDWTQILGHWLPVSTQPFSEKPLCSRWTQWNRCMWHGRRPPSGGGGQRAPWHHALSL